MSEYFNPKAFVNCSNFSSFDEVVKYIIEIDNNETLYREIRSQRPILDDSKLRDLSRSLIEEQILAIAAKSLVDRPISKRWDFPIYRIYKSMTGIMSKMKNQLPDIRNRLQK